MSSEKQLLDELSLFKGEVMSALKFLYLELAIKEVASKNKQILNALNYTPTFWNTILNALQHSTFITLGRIFNPDSNNFSIHRLFRIFENNKDLFTKDAFKERWMKDTERSKIDNWLPKYLEELYVPSNNDFREFKKFIAKQKKIYDDIYRPVRNHFGHKIYSQNEDVKGLFDKIMIKDLEKFCVSLNAIHEALWQLYHNGNGPLLPIKKGRYSTRSILKYKQKKYNALPANVQFINEAKIALDLLKKGNNFRQKSI